MHRAHHRLAVIGALSAALMAGAGATAAVAAPAKPALSAQASVKTVKAWQAFRVSGKATGIRTGTVVTLQQKQGTTWVSLPASVPVDKASAYSMHVKLGIKGKNALRITGGGAISPEFSVTVR
ncbi:hypothetical protein AB0K09_05405 [Streptomyces sp. NPDC049577]|uniref:hypothetical protein n=1 Tax=Streptomyces sp. NPDC049577 TaxID=3155153 RepID=UPI00343CB7F4